MSVCLFSVTQYRVITQQIWGHRKESDTGAGAYRENIDQLKVEGSCAQALWSKGVGQAGGIDRGLQRERERERAPMQRGLPGDTGAWGCLTVQVIVDHVQGKLDSNRAGGQDSAFFRVDSHLVSPVGGSLQPLSGVDQKGGLSLE